MEADQVIQLDIDERFQSQGYTLLKKIGQGGFGSVYKARKLSTNQVVAIKFLNLSSVLGEAKRESYISRFHREAALSGLLQHPNIVRLLDKGVSTEGSIYAVFEYIEGSSLKEVLQERTTLPAPVTANVMGQVLSALSHAHEHGVIHRDLKPANIMLVSSAIGYHVKILDFGIATLTLEARGKDYNTITLTHEALGTPSYCAPEQLRGEPPTTKSDLYVWGLVFIECLTGSPAIEGASLASVFHKQLSKHHVYIPSCLLNHPVSSLLRRVLHKSSKDRLAKASQVYLELKKINFYSLVGNLTDELLSSHHKKPDKNYLNNLHQTKIIDSLALYSRVIERKPLSILCVSMTIMSIGKNEINSEVVEALFDDQVSRILDLAISNGGFHTGTLGDTQLFYFGYPSVSDNDARLCAITALDLIDQVKEWNSLLGIAYGVQLGLQIGMNTGLATFHPDIVPIGDTVNIAMKLARLSGMQQILCSSSSSKVLGSFAEFLPGKVASIKDSLFPVDAYQLIGEKFEETFSFHKGRYFNKKITGRKKELQLIANFLKTDSQFPSIYIHGEAGIGKSRLIYEAKNIEGNLKCVVGQCLPEHQYEGLYPVLNIIRDKFSLDLLSDEKAFELISGTFLSVDRVDVCVIMPILCSWLNLSVPDNYSILVHSASLQKQYLFEALLILIESNNGDMEGKKTLLVIEDFHWADVTTIEFMNYLLLKLKNKEVDLKLLLSSRASPPSELKAENLINLKLEGLQSSESVEFIKDLFDREKLSDNLISEIVSRTNGIPLFVEEMISMLKLKGAVQHLNGVINFTSSADVAMVPETLRASLQQKVENLAHSKNTAQLSSVIGREFDCEQVLAISGKTREQLSLDLKELVSNGVLYRKRLTYVDVYVFKHALVKDAVYESMAASTRVEIHRHVASVLMKDFKSDMDKSPGMLARHWELAERPSQSADWYILAAKNAQDNFQLEESIANFKHSIRQLKLAKKSKDLKRYYIPYIGLGDAYSHGGNHEKGRSYFKKAIYENGTTHIDNVLAYLKIGKTWEVTHKYEFALNAYNTAEDLLVRAGFNKDDNKWIDEWLRIQSAKLSVNYWRGNIENMFEYIEKTEVLVLERGNDHQKSRYYTDLLHLNVRKKRYLLDSKDVDIARKSSDFANKTQDIELQAFCCFALGFSLYFNDKYLEAQAELEYGLTTFGKLNDIATRCRFSTYLSIVYRRCGDIKNTSKYSLMSLDSAKKSARNDYVAAAQSNLAWVEYKFENLKEAVILARNSDELWEDIKEEYPFPFQWLSLLIELDILTNKKAGDGGDSVREIVHIVKIMMDDSQQILPSLISENLGLFLDGYLDENLFVDSYLDVALAGAKKLNYL